MTRRELRMKPGRAGPARDTKGFGSGEQKGEKLKDLLENVKKQEFWIKQRRASGSLRAYAIQERIRFRERKYTTGSEKIIGVGGSTTGGSEHRCVEACANNAPTYLGVQEPRMTMISIQCSMWHNNPSSIYHPPIFPNDRQAMFDVSNPDRPPFHLPLHQSRMNFEYFKMRRTIFHNCNGDIPFMRLTPLNLALPRIDQLQDMMISSLQPPEGETPDINSTAFASLQRFRPRFDHTKTSDGAAGARAAQWGSIDRQMLLFRNKSSDYFLSWSELILQKHDTVFGSGQWTHKNLPDDISDMPTDNKVVARDRQSQNRDAPELQQRCGH
ncbi:hypothetical protein VP01_147g1 [Puccinia sorghi]|uniref:Uncharacterized protein n=1 Tax=Puccinia sorghi TaxID=27349 RepID=A0A0L6VJP7_9BASI|nr:hypothetical protein VP01_147g1 [Puccinia sorghi]